MSGRVYRGLLLAFALFAGVFSASAEDDTGAYGTFTPYSIFGFGDLYSMGSAYTTSMGGVGIASRNHRYINPMNPAAVTARDSLAFMVDFSLYQGNKYFRQDAGSSNLTSVSNTFNIGDCIISFPIYRSSAMMVGIMPYSNTGYGYNYFETDPKVIADCGNISYAYGGQGAIYQLFAAAGVTFWDRLSIGAEAMYYFGNIVKKRTVSFSEESYRGYSGLDRTNINTFSGKFGLQFFQPVGADWNFGVGATYKLGSPMRGAVTYDGVEGELGSINFADELGAGLSARFRDVLTIEFDYLTSDWAKSGFENDRFFSVNGLVNSFAGKRSQSFRLGAEYVPDRRDPRYYFRRVSYRAGVYYNDEYFTVGGNKIDAKGLTVGATFPVFNGFNAVTVAIDLGRRGSLKNSMVRETYINFSFAVNLYDRWFYKMQYD